MSDTLNMTSPLNCWLVDGDSITRGRLQVERISVSTLATGEKVLVIQKDQEVERFVLPPEAAARLAASLKPA